MRTVEAVLHGAQHRKVGKAPLTRGERWAIQAILKRF
jgi:hypothetical protein